jgi:hypothetical protein
MATIKAEVTKLSMENNETLSIYLPDGGFIKIATTEDGRKAIFVSNKDETLVEEWRGAIDYHKKFAEFKENDGKTRIYNVQYFRGLTEVEDEEPFMVLTVFTKSRDEKEIAAEGFRQHKITSYPKSYHWKIVGVN